MTEDFAKMVDVFHFFVYRVARQLGYIHHPSTANNLIHATALQHNNDKVSYPLQRKLEPSKKTLTAKLNQIKLSKNCKEKKKKHRD